MESKSTALSRFMPVTQNTLGTAFEQLKPDIVRARIEYLRDPELTATHSDFKKGFFTFSAGFQRETLSTVLLGMKYSRVEWPKPFNPNNTNPQAVCISADGIRPSEKHPTPVHPSCVMVGPTGVPIFNKFGMFQPVCPHAVWAAKDKPPLCDEVFTLLLWEIDLGYPFIFEVKRTGITQLQRLKNSMVAQARTFAHPGLPINACERIIITTHDRGIYYIPIFRVADQIPLADAQEFAKYAVDLNSMFFAFDASQPEAKTQ